MPIRWLQAEFWCQVQDPQARYRKPCIIYRGSYNQKMPKFGYEFLHKLEDPGQDLGSKDCHMDAYHY